jgi:EAL and modified HD-GYP domain-containing signal transduction protein
MSLRPMTFARQPILAADGTVFAYELLYRGIRLAAQDAGTTMSARVLCEALGAVGFQNLAGAARVFVNFDQALLETNMAGLLPPGQGVVEILETVEPTPQVFKTLTELRRRGIGIAMDDFLFQPNAVPFLPHVDFVKIDVLAAAGQIDSVAHQLEHLHVPLIAEKVETHEQFKSCRELGFTYFQGYFFTRPQELTARRISASEIAVVALIAELQKPQTEAAEIAEKIGADLALVHQILKLANSAAYRRTRAVSSIEDAVILLGQEVIRQWASLLLLSRLGNRKPLELLAVALIRGRMCQALAVTDRRFGSGELLTVGLLSVLDALLDRPMDALVAELPLSQSLRDALCGHVSCPMRDILCRVIAYESGNWSGLGPLTAAEQVTLTDAFIGAAQFARAALGEAAPH